MDRTLSGATTPGQSGLRSNRNEWGTPHSPKLQHYWNLNSVIFRTLVLPLCRDTIGIQQPQPTRQLMSSELVVNSFLISILVVTSLLIRVTFDLWVIDLRLGAIDLRLIDLLLTLLEIFFLFMILSVVTK